PRSVLRIPWLDRLESHPNSRSHLAARSKRLSILRATTAAKSSDHLRLLAWKNFAGNLFLAKSRNCSFDQRKQGWRIHRACDSSIRLWKQPRIQFPRRSERNDRFNQNIKARRSRCLHGRWSAWSALRSATRSYVVSQLFAASDFAVSH